MNNSEWQALLAKMDEHEAFIDAWEPEPPDPSAQRCVQSKHRTLAHLRACQEQFLEVCLAFAEKPGGRIKLLHPWRHFEKNSYELVTWEEHLAKFKGDRLNWKRMLETTDRTLSGRHNHYEERSIETYTNYLLSHEHHHLYTPR